MITQFKIYESVNHGKLYPILKGILNGSDISDIKEIENYIDLDFDYKVDYPYNSDTQFELQLNEDDLENLLNISEGAIQYIRQMASDYNDYEHYIDKDELEYVGNYLSVDTLKEIKKLAEFTGIDIDVDKQGEILRLLEDLGLDEVIDNMMSEIRMEHERALEDSASDIINSLPFELGYPSYSSSFNTELTFDVENMINYIEKYNLKVNSIKEFIEKCDWSEFSYEISSYENLGDFKDLNTEVYNDIQNFTISPDELFPEFIKSDKLDLFKNLIDSALFEYKYKYWENYDKKDYTLFQIAKAENNSILEFLKSYKFQEWYLKDLDINNKKERYQQLVNDNIIHSKIVDKYEYLVGADKYNL